VRVLRVLLHDYSGHPFQAQLSRALAARGHEVEHVSCASYVSGKGNLVRSSGDPPRLSFVSLPLGSDFEKYRPLKRLRQELSYARLFLRHVRGTSSDVVIMCNVPLLAHWLIDRRLTGVAKVFWHQDVYSQAWGVELRRRLGRLGGLPATALDRMEAGISRRSHQVVVIASTFLPVHRRWGTSEQKLTVQPNWAPLGEIRPVEADEAQSWTIRHGLASRALLLYSGTIGIKHDASVLSNLIEHVRKRIPEASLVVVSGGEAAARLHDPSRNVVVLPYQPYEDLPRMFGAATALITLLDREASDYSVPSKTLSYLCAGRPVVAMLPSSNPAFQIVQDAGGLAFDLASTPLDEVADSVSDLVQDAAQVRERGLAARRYAERNFDIDVIADRFEAILTSALASHHHSTRT
jgi:colanic acid biosynthesis glycosyl transferase WcaI